jgi:hypothetical protein
MLFVLLYPFACVFLYAMQPHGFVFLYTQLSSLLFICWQSLLVCNELLIIVTVIIIVTEIVVMTVQLHRQGGVDWAYVNTADALMSFVLDPSWGQNAY